MNDCVAYSDCDCATTAGMCNICCMLQSWSAPVATMYEHRSSAVQMSRILEVVVFGNVEI